MSRTNCCQRKCFHFQILVTFERMKLYVKIYDGISGDQHQLHRLCFKSSSQYIQAFQITNQSQRALSKLPLKSPIESREFLLYVLYTTALQSFVQTSSFLNEWFFLVILNDPSIRLRYDNLLQVVDETKLQILFRT